MTPEQIAWAVACLAGAVAIVMAWLWRRELGRPNRLERMMDRAAENAANQTLAAGKYERLWADVSKKRSALQYQLDATEAIRLEQKLEYQANLDSLAAGLLLLLDKTEAAGRGEKLEGTECDT